MPEYQSYAIRNKTPGFRGLCVTSPNEEGPSVNLDPGEIVEVELTEDELADAIATGWFELVERSDASADARATAQAALASAAGDAPDGDLGDRIRAAIMMLDPEDDAHWTKDGLPATKAVEAMLGAETTRAAINEAAPGVTRPVAD